LRVVGLQPVLDAVVSYAPSPSEVQQTTIIAAAKAAREHEAPEQA
jgi:translation elongation factor EF-G